MRTLMIHEDGVYTQTFHMEACEDLYIEVHENVHATCVLTFEGTHFDVNKKVMMHKNSTLHLLYKNDAQSYSSVEDVTLYENAHLQVGYFEVNECEAKLKAEYHLLEMNANVEIITTTYAKQLKQYDLTCLHEHAYTVSNIENYAINDVHGKMDVVASGNIKKGAKGSKSHQATRVLTLADKESVKVTPLLLIDENDVEASHACGIGEMNEDHLYYLQTRGLNKRQALGLLTLSYILPILRIVEHEEQLKTVLEEEIQSKVGLAC